MSNPFLGGSANPMDVPAYEGKPVFGTKSGDPNAVIFDIENDSVNPAGAALVGSIMKQVDARLKTPNQTAATLMKIVRAQGEKIKHLEGRVDQQRTDVTNAIKSAVTGFVAEEDDTPPTMAELERMGERHRKTMDRLKGTKS